MVISARARSSADVAWSLKTIRTAARLETKKNQQVEPSYIHLPKTLTQTNYQTSSLENTEPDCQNSFTQLVSHA